MWIVHPDRVREVPRHSLDALAVARHQVDSLLDGLFNAKGAAPSGDPRAAFEHVHRSNVERCLRALGVQEPRIPSREGLEIGRDLSRGRHRAIVRLTLPVVFRRVGFRGRDLALSGQIDGRRAPRLVHSRRDRP